MLKCIMRPPRDSCTHWGAENESKSTATLLLLLPGGKGFQTRAPVPAEHPEPLVSVAQHQTLLPSCRDGPRRTQNYHRASPLPAPAAPPGQAHCLPITKSPARAPRGATLQAAISEKDIFLFILFHFLPEPRSRQHGFCI